MTYDSVVKEEKERVRLCSFLCTVITSITYIAIAMSICLFKFPQLQTALIVCDSDVSSLGKSIKEINSVLKNLET